MRDRWSDERLDDLNQRVEDGFNRVDADIRGLRGEMNDRFNRVDARFDAMQNRVDDRFDRVDARFDRIDDRFDLMQDRLESMQRLMIQFGGGMIAALCAALIGLIATQL
jgi:flagellar capping protein FliD